MTKCVTLLYQFIKVPQVSRIPLNKKISKQISEDFLFSLVKLNKKEEVLSFLEEFLTPTEKTMLSKRLGVALLLQRGTSYNDIAELLKVSTATIVVIKRTLVKDYSYRKVIEKLSRTLLGNEQKELGWLETVLRSKTDIRARAKLSR